MGGIEYVYWDGARLTPWMKYCLERLDADLRRRFGVHLVLDPSKGIRTEAEQTAIFLARYRPQRTGSGPYGDVRWWNGTRYVRHSGLGTVAAPRTSNHEIQGATAAVDVADSGGAGIGTMGSTRSNWLRRNAASYGLVPEGFNFGEAWHYAVPNIFTPVPGSGATTAPPVPEEDEDMKIIRWAANGACWLMTDESTDYIATGAELAALEGVFGPAKTVENAALTAVVASLKVPWAAMESTFRSQAFDNESRFGKGTSWTRTMAEAQRQTQFDASLAKSIDDLEKAIGDLETATAAG